MVKKYLAGVAASALLLAGILVSTSRGEGLSTSVPVADGAAVDYFLKIEGIEGESTDDRHKGEIEISSFSWGATQMGSHSGGGGMGAGKVSMNDFHFTKRIDKASPLLMRSTATGQHFPKATLIVRKSGGDQMEYIKYTLTDVLVSSYGAQGDAGGTPADSFSLNFAKIEYSYTPQGADGKAAQPVVATWDLKKATK